MNKNVEEIIFPLLQSLKRSATRRQQRTIDQIDNSLREIVSPFIDEVAQAVKTSRRGASPMQSHKTGTGRKGDRRTGASFAGNHLGASTKHPAQAENRQSEDQSHELSAEHLPRSSGSHALKWIGYLSTRSLPANHAIIIALRRRPAMTPI